jgi:hypothetical protein
MRWPFTSFTIILRPIKEKFNKTYFGFNEGLKWEYNGQVRVM